MLHGLWQSTRCGIKSEQRNTDKRALHILELRFKLGV